jgi:flagellar biosynthetic protein FliQ
MSGTAMPDEVMLGLIAREGLWLFAQGVLTFLVPVLAVALVVGLVQTILSISEQSLSFLPKLMALVVMLALMGERVLRGLAEFMESGLIDMVGAIR